MLFNIEALNFNNRKLYSIYISTDKKKKRKKKETEKKID